MRPTARTARRWVRRVGGTVMRRFGLVPEGTPDELGDDARLGHTRLTEQVMVFFPDTRTNLYQLRQWYAPLRVLHDRHPVVLVLQDSRAAAQVRGEVDLPVITVGRSAALDDLLARGEVKLALYVSHLPRNFLALRHPSLAHVYLGHGESDKAVSASNQIKAYDYCFVAGQAAVDRIAERIILYDVERHLVRIGRPQLDGLAERPSSGADGTRPTVVYAPTWEGAQPSVAYSSVCSHGARLVNALLESERFRVVYRPHPRTGANQADYAEADTAIRRLIERAAGADPNPDEHDADESGPPAPPAGHRVDTTADPVTALAEADLLITDISALAWDWLPSGRPLLISVPEASTAQVFATRLLDVAPRLDVAGLDHVVELVEGQLARDAMSELRHDLVEYYFGDTTPGGSTQRFVDACSWVIGQRDEEVATRQATARQATAAGPDDAAAQSAEDPEDPGESREGAQ